MHLLERLKVKAISTLKALSVMHVLICQKILQALSVSRLNKHALLLDYKLSIHNPYTTIPCIRSDLSNTHLASMRTQQTSSLWQLQPSGHSAATGGTAMSIGTPLLYIPKLKVNQLCVSVKVCSHTVHHSLNTKGDVVSGSTKIRWKTSNLHILEFFRIFQKRYNFLFGL